MHEMATKIIPPYILRMYIADLMFANELMTASDYVSGGVTLSPVVSLEDDPKLAPLGKPYMIYGFSEYDQKGNAVTEHSGVLSLLIYDRSFTTINNIISVIRAAFDDSMFATPSVNAYSTSKGMNGIRFNHLCCGIIDSAEPAETEGGRISGMVNIEYSYIDHTQVKTFQENNTWEV